MRPSSGRCRRPAPLGRSAAPHSQPRPILGGDLHGRWVGRWPATNHHVTRAGRILLVFGGQVNGTSLAGSSRYQFTTAAPIDLRHKDDRDLHSVASRPFLADCSVRNPGRAQTCGVRRGEKRTDDKTAELENVNTLINGHSKRARRQATRLRGYGLPLFELTAGVKAASAISS